MLFQTFASETSFLPQSAEVIDMVSKFMYSKHLHPLSRHMRVTVWPDPSYITFKLRENRNLKIEVFHLNLIVI